MQVKVTNSISLTAIFKQVEFPDAIHGAAVLAVIPGELMSGGSKGWLHTRTRRDVRGCSEASSQGPHWAWPIPTVPDHREPGRPSIAAGFDQELR